MKSLLAAFKEVFTEGALLSPKGAAYLCLIVAACYSLAVWRASKLYRIAEAACSREFVNASRPTQLHDAHDAINNVALREFGGKVATLLLWVAAAMAMFSVQAYIAVLSQTPAHLANWTLQGMRATYTDTPLPATPDAYDYQAALYMLVSITLALVASWVMVLLTFSNTGGTLIERTAAWLRVLTVRRPWDDIPMGDSRDTSAEPQASRINYRRTS